MDPASAGLRTCPLVNLAVTIIALPKHHSVAFSSLGKAGKNTTAQLLMRRPGAIGTAHLIPLMQLNLHASRSSTSAWPAVATSPHCLPMTFHLPSQLALCCTPLMNLGAVKRTEPSWLIWSGGSRLWAVTHCRWSWTMPATSSAVAGAAPHQCRWPKGTWGGWWRGY